MGSRNILTLPSLRLLVVTRARPSSTFCQVQRLTLRIALGQGNDLVEMRLVTWVKDSGHARDATGGIKNMLRLQPASLSPLTSCLGRYTRAHLSL